MTFAFRGSLQLENFNKKRLERFDLRHLLCYVLRVSDMASLSQWFTNTPVPTILSFWPKLLHFLKEVSMNDLRPWMSTKLLLFFVTETSWDSAQSL
ncbi:hypothetical protein TNIN_276061 [Trichonephila inaurata madagascariensis]|uniref:Uncharacterized protein n=1 Tax=Trichonephila inaurata madagascariensis TaxID=2747483 RepID=A0A8X6YGM5_9ARAC|nr:hypothetical protein TNIN_276061 [Trichonephila inaurata madagascariensis]